MSAPIFYTNPPGVPDYNYRQQQVFTQQPYPQQQPPVIIYQRPPQQYERNRGGCGGCGCCDCCLACCACTSIFAFCCCDDLCCFW